MLVIGLTGGIGSGKTTVADCFARLGVPIIDTDELARELVQSGQPALDEITQQFGNEILNNDGTLNRRKLRQLVFSAAAARRKLESILHPRIRSAVKSQIKSLSSPYCIVVIPLLFESGQADLVHRILVIDCEEQQQIQRATKRDAVELENIQAIMASQVSRQTRLDKADDIIHNNTAPEDLEPQIKHLHQQYLQLAQGCQSR